MTSELKRTLVSMKRDPRETLSEVVERLVESIRQLDETTLAEVEEARAQIHAGRYVTQEQLRDGLGF